VMKQMDELFQEGIEFKKCGVILTCIENKAAYIPDLLSDVESIERNEKLQLAMEGVKERFGDKKLAIGPCKLPNRGWSMSRGSLTRDYFSWEGMLTVNN